MNAAIEWANGFAAHWARGMWPVLWQTAALAAIVGLIVLSVRRMSPALRFWLWMLVPLRLLVMPLITISLPVLAPPPAVQPPAVVAPHSGVSPAPLVLDEPSAMPAMPAERVAAPVVAPARTVSVGLWTWLMAAWGMGLMLFALRLARGWLRMRKVARQARENTDARVRDCVREAAALLGLRKTPKVMSAADGVSPFVLGFVRPMVVLPAALADHVSPDELRTVLAHEFAHVRRRDALLGWILACADVVYFFNPVVHLVKRAIMFERERACDEQVLALANAPRAVYARALLSAAGLNREPSQRLSCAPVLLESSRNLERRLKSIAEEVRPSAGLARRTKLALLLLAVLALPGFTCTRRSATTPRNEASCSRNLGLTLNACIIYSNMDIVSGALPPSLADLVPNFLNDPKTLVCPADKAPMKLHSGLPCSYRYIGNVPWRGMATPLLIAYDHAQHDGGRNVAYLDGRVRFNPNNLPYYNGTVQFIPEQDFQKSLAELYEQLKPLMTKLDFPGDIDRVKAFCEDKDFQEQAAPAAPRPAITSPLDWRFHARAFPGVTLKEAVGILKKHAKGVNFVIDPKWPGDPLTFTLDLKDITLAQTLDAILKPRKMNYVFADNVIFIATEEGCAAYNQYVEPVLPEAQASRFHKQLNGLIRGITLPGVRLADTVNTILNPTMKALIKDPTFAIEIDPALRAKQDQYLMNLDLKDVPLRTVLKAMLAPLDLEYTFVGENIVIREKPPAGDVAKPKKE